MFHKIGSPPKKEMIVGKRNKIRLWIKILIVPILIGVFWILINNGFLFERIRNSLNSRYKLKIERIEGNLFTYLDLKGVKFDKVFNAPRVLISYTPWSIIKRQIREVKIESPIFQRGEGRYTITSPFNVCSFILKDGRVLNISEVGSIESFDLEASLKRTTEAQVLRIARGEMEFKLGEELFEIDGIKGLIYLDESLIKIKRISLHTRGANIKLSGVTTPDSLDIELKASDFPLHKVVENVSGEVASDIHIVRSRRSLRIDGWVKLKNGEYKGKPIGELITDVALLDNDLRLKIKEWNMGETAFNGDIQIDLGSKPLSYRAKLNGEQIDLVTVYEELPTNLAGNIEIQGEGEELQSTIDLSGTVRDVRLESILAQLTYTPEEGIKILSFKATHAEGEVLARGNVNPEGIDLSMSGRRIRVGLFLPQFSGISNFDFLINGPLKNPGISGTFYIKDFEFGKIKSDYLSGNLNLVDLLPPEGEGEISFANLDVYTNRFESFKAMLTTTHGRQSYEIKAHSEATDLKIEGDGYGENIRIHNLSFHSPMIQTSNDEDIRINFRENQANIESCKLLVNDAPFQIGGLISKNKLDLTIVGRNINLHNFSDVVEGGAYFTCNISGSVQRPVISIASEAGSFSYSGVKADKIFSALLYKDGLLHIERGEFRRGGGVGQISGELPMRLLFPGLGKSDKPMNIELTFSNFGEDILFPYHKFVELKEGKINGRLRIKGNPKHPNLYGTLNFVGENINAKVLGTSLKDAKAEVNFEGNKVTINTFEAKTSDGFVKIAGSAQVPGELDFDIYTKNLPIKTIEDVDVNVSTNLSLEGSYKSPKLRGDIKVEKAVVMKEFEKRTSVNLQHPVDYDLTVDFPDKAWIRNSMVDAELSGKVKVRKVNNDFFLAGDVGVKKGYYYYFERPFKIERGEFKFTNSPELNPKIDLLSSTAVTYTAPDTVANRDTTTTDTIKLKVTGTMREPEFTLSSEPPMPLEDIISLLSLNIRSSDLMKLQSFEYAQTVGVKAISYYGLRKLRILEDLKSQMGVDALRLEEVVFGEEKRARFNIGKYVLEDLYVSYTNDIFSLSKYNFKAEYSPWKYGSLIGETEGGKLKAGVQFKIRY